MLIISIILFLKKPQKKKVSSQNKCSFIDPAPGSEEAKSRIFKHCKNIGCDKNLAKIFVAHSWVESGNYDSNIYKSCNNLVGMGRVYKRNTTQCGFKDFGTRKDEPRYMGQYFKIEDCIDDWFLWWQMHGYSIARLNIYNLRDILTIMKKHKYYVIDKDKYIQIVKGIYDTL